MKTPQYVVMVSLFVGSLVLGLFVKPVLAGTAWGMYCKLGAGVSCNQESDLSCVMAPGLTSACNAIAGYAGHKCVTSTYYAYWSGICESSSATVPCTGLCAADLATTCTAGNVSKGCSVVSSLW